MGVVIVYTLRVTVTRPVDSSDPDSPHEATAEWTASAEAKREMEREVLRALKKLDGDCDCEVMETVSVTE